MDNVLLFVLSESLYILLLLGFYYSYKYQRLKEYLFSIFLSLLFSTLLKIAFKIPRPLGSGYSFPSRHASLAFASSYFLPSYFLILAILISISRVILGYHRMEDIIVGALLGYFVSYYVDLHSRELFDRISKNKVVIERKIVHIISISLVLFFSFLIPIVFPYILLILLCFPVILKFYKIPMISDIYERLIEYFGKPEEISKFFPYGAFYILLSSLLLYFLFPREIFCISLLTLMFGDSLSTFGDILFHSNYRKTPKFKGMGYLFSFLFLYAIFSYFYNPFIALNVGLGYLIGELLERTIGLDDNLTIPLVTAVIVLPLL